MIGEGYKSSSTKHLVIAYDLVLGSNHKEKFSDWLDYKRNVFELRNPDPFILKRYEQLNLLSALLSLL